MEASVVGSGQEPGFGLSVVAGFVFGGWDVPDGAVQPPVAEPVGVLGGGQFDLGEGLPGPFRLISSVLYRPIVDSIRALSRASPTVPMEASIPASIRWAVNTKLTYCLGSGDRRNTGLLGRV